jgi:hypothetical protein
MFSGRLGRPPTAIRIVSAVCRPVPPSSVSTSTAPGAVTRARPWKICTPLVSSSRT